MKYDLLLKNTMILNPDGSVTEGQYLAIKDRRIARITADVIPDSMAAQVLDCTGKLTMPGMVDGHTHTSQQLLRGRLADEYPMIWTRFLVPFESTLHSDDVYYSALLYCIQAIKAGITGFAESGGRFMERTIQAAVETGMRAAVARSMMDSGREITPQMLETKEEALDRNDALYETYQGAGDGRIQVYYGMRQVMTCTPAFMESIAEHANARHTGIHAHLCEHRNEVSFCLQNYKLRPVELMEKVGMLGPRLVTAHNVALSEHDITLLSKYRVKLIHCPFANLINHGFPKTPTLLESGCYVGLGSDGAAYNSVDLFEEMRVLRACLISYYGLPAFDPVVMPIKTALRLSTEGGAAALGMENCLGRVEEGCIADLITVNMMRPHIFPTNNRTTAILDTVTAQDVEDSIIDGKLIMEHRILKTIDEAAVMKECAARMQSINRQFQ